MHQTVMTFSIFFIMPSFTKLLLELVCGQSFSQSYFKRKNGNYNVELKINNEKNKGGNVGVSRKALVGRKRHTMRLVGR